jgi:hypothetical protein
MENTPRPRPTQIDYDRILQLEEKQHYGSEYERLFNNHDWHPVVFEENGLYGLNTAVGTTLLPALFQEFMLSTGNIYKPGNRIVVQQNDKWGVVLAGEEYSWLVPPMYDYIGYPNSITAVCTDDKWGLLNIIKNEFLIPLDCETIGVDQGFVFCNGIGYYKRAGKYGIIHESYHFTDAIYDDLELEPEGPVKVMLNGEWGYIDQNDAFTLDEHEAAWCAGID